MIFAITYINIHTNKRETARIKADSPGEAWREFMYDISKSGGRALNMRVDR
jgi:hypothetical protein